MSPRRIVGRASILLLGEICQPRSDERARAHQSALRSSEAHFVFFVAFAKRCQMRRATNLRQSLGKLTALGSAKLAIHADWPVLEICDEECTIAKRDVERL